MRLYTVLREGKEELFVSLDGGRTGCFLKDAGRRPDCSGPVHQRRTRRRDPEHNPT